MLAGVCVIGWLLLLKLLEAEQKPGIRVDEEDALDREARMNVEQEGQGADDDDEEEEEEGAAIIQWMNGSSDDKMPTTVASKHCQEKAWERAENDFR